MVVDEGGGGYGFARRNNQARKKAGRRPAVHPNAPRTPDSHAAPSQKPVWVWLLIGFLLGTGGTLLTSSFWLPESGDHHVATLETDDARPQATDGMTAKAVTELPLPKEAPSEPRPEGTLVAALDVDPSSTESDVERASLEPEGMSQAPADLIEDTETSTGKSASETLQSADAPSDDVEGRPIDGDLSNGPGTPEQAAPTLVAKTVSSEALPSPEDPTFDEASAAQPAVAEPADELDDEPIQAEAASPRPLDAEAASVNDAEQSELPPRIRQALRAAKEARQSAPTSESGGGARLYRVQLAAVNDEAAARVFWREVNERLPGVFADVEPIFDQRLVDERLYLRIWVGAFDNRLDADGYCGWLKQKGQDCFVTRVDNL